MANLNPPCDEWATREVVGVFIGANRICFHYL